MRRSEQYFPSLEHGVSSPVLCCVAFVFQSDIGKNGIEGQTGANKRVEPHGGSSQGGNRNMTDRTDAPEIKLAPRRRGPRQAERSCILAGHRHGQRRRGADHQPDVQSPSVRPGDHRHVVSITCCSACSCRSPSSPIRRRDADRDGIPWYDWAPVRRLHGRDVLSRLARRPHRRRGLGSRRTDRGRRGRRHHLPAGARRRAPRRRDGGCSFSAPSLPSIPCSRAKCRDFSGAPAADWPRR
jgi:hypothetical protein